MADILFRGMEMPQHCFNCSTKIDPDNRRCNIDGHVFVETLSKLTCRRDENCPIAELPPHGDLIDRDSLDFEDDIYGWRDKKIVKAAPVVIPASKEEST